MLRNRRPGIGTLMTAIVLALLAITLIALVLYGFTQGTGSGVESNTEQTEGELDTTKEDTEDNINETIAKSRSIGSRLKDLGFLN